MTRLVPVANGYFWLCGVKVPLLATEGDDRA
jgi:hypothetical protein